MRDIVFDPRIGEYVFDMTDKPTRGRPPKPANQQTKPYSVRLNAARIEKLKLLGSDWLNRAIDRAQPKKTLDTV